jgi:hypothetical protein
MRKRAKAVAIPIPGATLALGILFFVLSLMAASHAFGAEKPRSCKTVESLQEQKQREQDTLARVNADTASNPAMQSQANIIQDRINSIQARIYDLESDCTNDQAKADE